VLESSLAGLDRWSREWSGMRREACEATHVHHEQSPTCSTAAWPASIASCAAWRATTAVLRAADKDAVLHAVEAVDALPELTECADRER
jgi:hypothetical protein